MATIEQLRVAAFEHPVDAVSAYALGQALLEVEDYEAAEVSLRRAIQLDMYNPSYYRSLAQSYVALENWEQAAEVLEDAVKLIPNDDPDVLTELALIYCSHTHRCQEASTLMARAIRIDPASPSRYFVLARCYLDHSSSLQAFDLMSTVLPSGQNVPMLCRSLAHAFMTCGRYDEAIAFCNDALSLQSDDHESFILLGLIHSELREFEKAGEFYERAVQLSAPSGQALLNYSCSLYARGDYERALRLLQKHTRTWLAETEHGRHERWDGSNLRGKTILVNSVAGYGDSIQNLRFARLLKRQGAKVIVVTRRAVAPLLQSVFGIDLVVTRFDECPPCDVECQDWTACVLCECHRNALGRFVPYLDVSCDDVARYKRLLSRRDLNVGIVWQSSDGGSRLARREIYTNRDVPLAALFPIQKIPGISLYSLQKGRAALELRMGPFRFSASDLSTRLSSFTDTAALVAALDVVISVDTAVAHVSGALGKNTLLLLPYAADWRWGNTGSDSLLYPSLKLFRQSRPGDWSGVIESVGAELRRLSATAGRACPRAL